MIHDPVTRMRAIVAKAEGCPIPQGDCECASSIGCVLAAVLEEIVAVDRALGPWRMYEPRSRAIEELRGAAGPRDECP